MIVLFLQFIIVTMGGCLGQSSEVKKPIQSQKISRVEEVDLIKVKLKGTRDKIDNLINQHNIELSAVNQQIQKQKDSGLKNKAKAVYLLKQRKDFDEQVLNLNTRKQAVIKTLGMLAQQQLDKQMVDVLEESNKYMRMVENELERRNWREILAEAKDNRYNPIEFRQAEEDPDVDALFAKLQLEVQGQKAQVPRVKDVVQVEKEREREKQKEQRQLIHN